MPRRASQLLSTCSGFPPPVWRPRLVRRFEVIAFSVSNFWHPLRDRLSPRIGILKEIELKAQHLYLVGLTLFTLHNYPKIQSGMLVCQIDTIKDIIHHI